MTRDLRSPRWPLGLSLFALSCLLHGCAVTGPAVPPPVPVAPAFKEEGAWHGQAARTDAVPSAWWTCFGDPQLNALEDALQIGNQNLRVVAAQLDAARAAVDASQSALRPTLGVTASGSRARTPATAKQGPSTGNSFQLEATSSWEVDLWGRYRLALQGARDSAQASEGDLKAARLSAQATLASSYFALRTADAQDALQVRAIQAYQRSLSMTQARVSAGVAAESDMLQARAQLNTAQSQLAETRLQRAQLEHAIAVLLGRAPAELDLPRDGTLPAPPSMPTMLPSRVLENRPDVAAAQQRVAAAYAQIGVADAAFYPDVSLSADGGFRASQLSRLLSTPNLLWSLGPSMVASLFDSGAHELASRQARAAAEEATASYRQTVLTALQEVEDNLVAARQLHDEWAAQQLVAQDTERSLNMTLAQYEAGTVSYLNVVAAQVSDFTAQSNQLAAQNRLLAASNILLKNTAGLAGGLAKP